MKHLYLIRHAKSSWTEDGIQDRIRPLSKRGREQLGSMSKAILAAGALDGPVFCSHAVRARQTLEGLIPADTRPAIHIERTLYTFNDKVLIDWLRDRQDEDRITLVGHNPALEKLAAYLVKEAPGSLPTCGFMHLSLPIKHWRELTENKGRLAQFLRPKDVSYKAFNRKRKKIRSRGKDRPLCRHIPETLQHLYQRMRDLEAGVIQGYDDEFLHQYRIAIRRSRAIAESVSEIGAGHDLRQELKALKNNARATSHLRDIHVLLADLDEWLLKEQTCDVMVASGLRSHFTKLAEIERQNLIKHLTGKKCRDSMNDWRQLIHARHFKSILPKLTTADIRKALNKRLRRYNKLTQELSRKSPDNEVHTMRKLLKRIRYLAELDKPAFRDLRKQLKHRQQRFGKFQDLYVQINFLLAFRDGLATESDMREPPAGLNNLIDGLAAEKQDVLDDILALCPSCLSL